MKKLEEQTKPTGSIIGKTTQDIKPLDPTKEKPRVANIEASDPVTAPLMAYGPMIEQISKVQIEHTINLFHATHGRYPKNYEEFMEKIITENGITLPALPLSLEYRYDVENHKLVVVEKAKSSDPPGQ